MTKISSSPESSGISPLDACSGAAPDDAEWANLAAGHAAAFPGGVDVIIPAYGGYSETLRSIHRVLSARNDTPFRLVVIDDASPDPALGRRIAELAQAGLFLGLRNERNLGFVATANRGLKLGPGRDVILLNADTEVFDGWLDRLHAAAHSQARIGTVTPLSNAATILSYPLWLEDHTAPLELSAATLDRLCALGGAAPVEIPTAIGFCMYLRRDCIEQVGLFDEAAFGRGYGEENDFCMRAAALGWKHVAAVNTYVWHWGGRSFGAEKARRLEQAMHTLRRLHPHYEQTVRDFIERDPLAPLRASLDVARIRRMAPRNRLGAAPPSVDAGERGLLGLVRVSRWNGRRWRLRHDRLDRTPNLPQLDLRDGLDAAAQLLRALGVDRVRPPADFSGASRSALRQLAADIGAQWEGD